MRISDWSSDVCSSDLADAPSPPYPRAALRAGLQGTVMLQVLVDVDGRPLQVDVEHRSGYRVLDNAARRYVLQHWTFRPAMRGGRDRKGLVEGTRWSGRVDLGGRRSLKKKKKQK